MTRPDAGPMIVIVTSRAKIFGLGDKRGDMRLTFRSVRRWPQMSPRAEPGLDGTATMCGQA